MAGDNAPIVIRNCTVIARTEEDVFVSRRYENGDHLARLKLDGYLIVPLEWVSPETLEQLERRAAEPNGQA